MKRAVPPQRAASGLEASPEDLAVRLDAAMERYVDGDIAGFEELYEGLAGELLGYLLSFVRDRARAEDLLQATFLRLHGARGSWIRGAHVRPYLFAIARNAAIDAIRSQKVNRVLLTASGEPPDVGEVPVDEGIDEQLQRALCTALSRLPETHREALLLTKQRGLSLREAAAVVGATETAVKLRVHRAYKALRQELKGLWPGKERS